MKILKPVATGRSLVRKANVDERQLTRVGEPTQVSWTNRQQIGGGSWSKQRFHPRLYSDRPMAIRGQFVAPSGLELMALAGGRDWDLGTPLIKSTRNSDAVPLAETQSLSLARVATT